MEFLIVSPHNPYQKEFRAFIQNLEGVETSVVSNLQNLLQKASRFNCTPDSNHRKKHSGH